MYTHTHRSHAMIDNPLARGRRTLQQQRGALEFKPPTCTNATPHAAQCG